MNFIKSQLGGFNFVMEDLDYIQESTKTQLEGIISYYSQKQRSFVWSGCDIVQNGSNGSIELSSGWVVVDGELMKYDGQIISVSNQEEKVKFEKFTTDEVLNPASVKLTDSNTSYYGYKKVRAKLTVGLSGNANIDCSTYSLDDALQNWYTKNDVIRGKEKGLAAENGWNLSSKITYRKSIDGFVHVNANMIHSTGVNVGNFVTLPVGYRPQEKVRGIYVTDSNIVPCFVQPSGIIQFLGAAFENGSVVMPPFKV